MKRLLFLLFASVFACSFLSAETYKVTVTPSNPRMYNRFLYNYRSVLQDFEIDPDISGFISSVGTKNYPTFLVKGVDNFVYAVSAADVVAFADNVEVTVFDSVSKISFHNLQVININERLNLAVIRLPKNVNVNALDIDSVWFSDESEQYSLNARMFLHSVPMTVSGDANTLSVLYNRLVNAAPEGYYYILPNVSYKYLYSKSADQIADGIDSLSESNYQLFRNLNANGDVISAMRVLAGDMAARNMKRQMVCTNTIINDDEVVLEGRNGEYVTFINEFGAWRIISDSKPQAVTTTNTATYTQNGSTLSSSSSNSVIDHTVFGTIVSGSVMVPYNFRDQGISFSLSLGYAFRFFSMEALFVYNSFGVNRDRNYNPDLYAGKPCNSDYHYSNFIGLGIRFGGFVPIKLNDKLSIAPNLKFEWTSPNMCRDTYCWTNSIAPITGADLFFKISNSTIMSVGLGYEHQFRFNRYDLVLKKTNMGYINFNIGFIF